MKEVKKWVDKAKSDLKKAKDNFNIKNYDIAVFLCQQSVEKILKAILIKKKGDFLKTHDLVKLGRDVNLPENLINEVKELTLAYIYTRYPDVEQDVDLKEKATYFLKVAQKILKWAEKNL